MVTLSLTVKQVEKLIREAKPGATSDGGGLVLRVTDKGSTSWQYRYTLYGKRRLMGLGSTNVVTLAEARDKAAEARKLVAAGVDPLSVSKEKPEAKIVMFDDAAADYIASQKAGWKSAKHAQQWQNTLRDYASPVFGHLPVGQIDTALVLKALTPIWSSKPETAKRVRNRIELVLDSARARGLLSGPNPAAWRGHLDKLLPKRTKASKGHHAAMAYAALPAFYQRLQSERESLSAKALALTILTATRTSETLQADWSEFDLQARIWTIPAKRMKSGREHRVPLSGEAVRLVESLPTRSGWLFPGARKGKPLSGMSMAMCLRKIGPDDVTVHGFRSTFRDWAAEETHHPNVVAEMALAHTVGNAVEAAYRRGDLLEKRKVLMNDWAMFCTAGGVND